MRLVRDNSVTMSFAQIAMLSWGAADNFHALGQQSSRFILFVKLVLLGCSYIKIVFPNYRL